MGCRWVEHINHGVRLEPVIGFGHLVPLGYGLGHVAKGALVDEGEMRVVERVFHEAQRRTVPHFVKLLDTAETGIGVFRNFRNVSQRLAQAHPNVAIARLAVERVHPEIRGRLPFLLLRNERDLTGPVIAPAVITADDFALVAPTLG